MKQSLGKYQNGNFTVRILEDGTKIRQTEEDRFIPDFAENMDIKICDRCSAMCPMCHEGSTPNGKLGDIMNEEFIDTLHPYQEVALGGGNVLEHPDFVPFLRKLKEKNVIANITLNQKHFMENQELVFRLVKEKLVYGIGVSLVSATDEFIQTVANYPNAVIHVIHGVVTEEDLQKLSDHNLKLLILGYKHLRRGELYFEDQKELIQKNQRWLYDHLGDLFAHFAIVSFDNLAIEQLQVKRFLSEEEWEAYYMGDDAEFTYYIDMVNRQFAANSTAPMDERYDLLDSVDEMFERIRKK